MAVNGAALGLLMVNVPTDVPLTTMLAGATATLMVGGSYAVTVSEAVLVLVFTAAPSLSAPGETVAV